MLRLDRMEILGFKSFSDRTEVRFPDGVTAIVGPNGCGKSNIGDALIDGQIQLVINTPRGKTNKADDAYIRGGSYLVSKDELSIDWREDESQDIWKLPSGGTIEQLTTAADLDLIRNSAAAYVERIRSYRTGLRRLD